MSKYWTSKFTYEPSSYGHLMWHKINTQHTRTIKFSSKNQVQSTFSSYGQPQSVGRNQQNWTPKFSWTLVHTVASQWAAVAPQKLELSSSINELSSYGRLPIGDRTNMKLEPKFILEPSSYGRLPMGDRINTNWTSSSFFELSSYGQPHGLTVWTIFPSFEL